MVEGDSVWAARKEASGLRCYGLAVTFGDRIANPARKDAARCHVRATLII
jgi:hypothetical protein